MSLGAQELCYGKTLKAVFLWSRRHWYFWPEMSPEVGLPKETIRGGDSPVEMEIRKELEMEIRRAR